MSVLKRGTGKTAAKLANFVRTNKHFVLTIKQKLSGSTAELEDELEVIPLIQVMPIDERVTFYFDNFSSLFVSIAPEDIGNLLYVPTRDEDYEDLEKTWKL